MKKILFTVLLPVCCNAQNFEIGINAGVPINIYDKFFTPKRSDPYFLSGYISFTRLHNFDFGVSYNHLYTFVFTNVANAFIDLKLGKKNNIIIGINAGINMFDDYYYTASPNGKNYYTISHRFDNSISCGLRLGYQKHFGKRFNLNLLINPTSTTVRTSNGINSYKLFYMPITIGCGFRF